MDLFGIGPAGAARILCDVGDVARFPDRNHCASPAGTAPLDASSGDQIRHRLSPGREPQDEPRAAHRRDRADPPRHRRSRPTTGASWPSPRPRGKRCAASNDASPTRSTASSWPTRRPCKRRAREGTRGRLHDPARPTCPPRSSALRTSHFPDPHPRRHPRARPLRRPARARLPAPRDDAPEPSRCSAPPDERPRRRQAPVHTTRRRDRALDTEGKPDPGMAHGEPRHGAPLAGRCQREDRVHP